MYTTLAGLPTDAPEPTADEAAAEAAARAEGKKVRNRRVSSIVITLGTVSFFTDLSSEMVVAVLPVYLTLVLGLSPVQYGLIDGLYQGVTAAVRIVGGIAADLGRRPKLVALLGYGLSCVCKLFFLPAASFGAIMGLVALDRSGKGLRTAPRDTMIVEASDPKRLGYAFGVHRAMDTAGALGGPLIAFGILALLTDGYDLIFVLSFGLAAIGVAVLVLFVPAHPIRPAAPAETPVPRQTTGPVRRKGALRRTVREFGGLVHGSTGASYRRLLAVGALLSLGTISDGFVYLVLRERVGVSAVLFPLLFVGTAAAYLVLAIPFGRLADRIGRTKVFIGGHVLAAVGYLALWLAPTGPALVVIVLGLVGSYYAATDGVLPALTAPIVPESVRTSGIAGVQTVMAVGSMLSATVFGTVWSHFGQLQAVAAFAVGLGLAIPVALRLLGGVGRSALPAVTGAAGE
jgi:MFS family permease